LWVQGAHAKGLGSLWATGVSDGSGVDGTTWRLGLVRLRSKKENQFIESFSIAKTDELVHTFSDSSSGTQG
jgi:hypothetical protein